MTDYMFLMIPYELEKSQLVEYTSEIQNDRWLEAGVEAKFPEPETSAGRGEVETAAILVAGSKELKLLANLSGSRSLKALRHPNL